MVTYPHGFIGPIRPGDKIAPAPFIGPVRRGGGSRRPTPTSNVRISGGTVFINGQGFSVAPNLQEQFIRDRTGGRGTSAQTAIQQAISTEAARKEAARQALLRAERVRADLIKRQALLRSQGAKISRKKSIDSKTRQRIVITETKLGSEKIREIRNLDTGDVTINRYGVNGGGGVRLQAGITIKGKKKVKGKPTAADLAARVKISKISKDKILIIFPNGRRVTMGTKGKGIVGKELAGHKYLFEDGVIIAVDGKSTFAREEFVPSAEVQSVGKRTGSVNNIIDKLNILQKKSSTASIRNQQNSLINELSLLGITVATTIISGVTGFVALGGGVVKLIKKPSEIKKLPVVLMSIPGAVSKGGKSFGRLIVVSPTEAVGVVAGEVILFKGSGLAFKAVGKVSSRVARLVRPAIMKADRVKLIITGNTIKIAKRSKAIRRAISRTKKIKAVQVKEIEKFKSAVEYAEELKRARAIRKLASKRGRTISIGNRDFIKSVAFVEDTADKLATLRAKQFLKKYKAKGLKLGLGERENFIRATRRLVKKNLNEYPTFKKLKEYSKFTEPYQIKLLKTGKILTAKKLVSRIRTKIGNFPITKQMNSIIKRITKTIKKIKKAPRKIKKRLAEKKAQRVARKQFRQTNRYRMQKTRGIRKVTTQQIERSLTVNQYRKFIDDFFDEVASRQNVRIGDLKYRQFKNVMKKRISWAIKRGDVTEINKFKVAIRKIVRDMNKPAKAPAVRIVKKGTRSFKTIKDFKPEVPKGQYVEVKKGQQILVQKIRQIQKTKQIQQVKQVQKMAQQQVFVIQSVQKQSINLMPLLQFGVVSLSALAYGTLQKQQQKLKSGQALSTKQISRVLQDSAQDFKVLQDVAQISSPRLNVAQAVKQDVASKLKLKSKLITRQIKEKKKIIPRIISQEKFKKKTVARKVPVFYIKVKKKGRIINLLPRPLILRDAKDYLAYKLDKNLVRTAYFEPIGRAKNVVRIPKNMQGYFTKIKRKLRPYKIRVGKKKLLRNGYIEKRKFALDTKREKAQLKKARRTKRKKK